MKTINYIPNTIGGTIVSHIGIFKNMQHVNKGAV